MTETTQAPNTSPQYVNPELIDAVVARHLDTVPIRELIRVYNETAIIHFSRMDRDALWSYVETNYPELLPMFSNGYSEGG